LVRPEIAIDFDNHKFVAVGGKLFHSPKERCRFFADFLIDYVPQVFGRPWFEQEVAEPPDQRHPVMRWRTEGMNFMGRQPQLADGRRGAIPTGPLAAYVTFAYDLYTVDNNARLDALLVKRLKHVEQFQGARHELFAEATCLRASYDIEHEDETDGTRRHAEFSATHKATGQRISVEAKSRHRPGVLGQPGAPEPTEEMSLRFGRLLTDAVAKDPSHPLVVFLDTNLPYERAAELYPARSATPPVVPKQFTAPLDKLRRENNGRDPIALTIFTNHAQHYATADEIVPSQHLFTVFSSWQQRATAQREALIALHHAANLYGNVPNEFPS
jgi:hypothetical protein